MIRDGSPTASATLTARAHALCRGATISRSIAVNDSLTTSHTSASCLIEGTYAEGWEFTTAETSFVSFSLLLGEERYPLLLIADSAMDNTFGGGVAASTDNLMLDDIVPPGTWRFWVTRPQPYPSYPTGLPGPPSGFPFTLKRNPAPVVCGAPSMPLTVGVPVAGSINSADCVTESPYDWIRTDQFTFTVVTEKTFDFALSASFSPLHLLLASNDSTVMINSRYSDPSMVTRKTLSPGTYTYVVRPLYVGTGGTYTITVTEP